MTGNFLLKIEPHDCHRCYWFAIQQTLDIKSTYCDLNLVPHSSEPCVLTSRPTHTAQRSLPLSSSKSCCGSFPGRASLTCSSDAPLQKGEVPGSSDDRWIVFLKFAL